MQTVKKTVDSFLRQASLGPTIRYGVVGAGRISQAAFIPGIEQTTNSVLSALISDDPEKREKLGKQYKLKTYSYDQFSQALDDCACDAFYIATPNNQHRKFAVPALERGYHVLLEKPMAASVEDCEAILTAQKKGGGKLMIAYRLHHDAGTLDIIDRVRKGDFGDPRIFSSIFTQKMTCENHRAKNGFDAGPIPDMGIYPINAARNIFGLEPIEVTAIGFKTPGNEFLQMDEDTVQVTLRFPGDRVAQFIVGYASIYTERYLVIGTGGVIEVNPSYGFGSGVKISYKAKVNGKEETKSFSETDHFGGETEYFSDCILNKVDPEADGEEGLFDVRVVAAIKESLKDGGKTIKLEPKQRSKRPTSDQVKKLALGGKPKILVGQEAQRAAPN